VIDNLKDRLATVEDKLEFTKFRLDESIPQLNTGHRDLKDEIAQVKRAVKSMRDAVQDLLHWKERSEKKITKETEDKNLGGGPPKTEVDSEKLESLMSAIQGNPALKAEEGELDQSKQSSMMLTKVAKPTKIPALRGRPVKVTGE
jgi:hypothetical protein